MENVKVGDLVVRKMDVGEPVMVVHVVQQAGEGISAIVPFLKTKYDDLSFCYRKSGFINENKMSTLVSNAEIASVCCINFNTELTNIICRNPTIEKLLSENP